METPDTARVSAGTARTCSGLPATGDGAATAPLAAPPAWRGLLVGPWEPPTARIAIGASGAPNAAGNLPRRQVVRGQASSALQARLTK